MLSSPECASRDELWGRALEATGKYNSGKKDVSEKHDEYLAEAYRQGRYPDWQRRCFIDMKWARQVSNAATSLLSSRFAPGWRTKVNLAGKAGFLIQCRRWMRHMGNIR